MTQWNPNAPEIIGLEWMVGQGPTSEPIPVLAGGNDSLLGLGTGYAQRARSLGAETIGAMRTVVGPLFGGRLYTEVYAAGTEIPGPPVAQVAPPTADETVVALVGSGAPPLFQYVDEAVLNPADYITQSGAISAGVYIPTYGSLAAFPAGRRVLSISVTYVVGAQSGAAQQVRSVLISGAGPQLFLRTDTYSQGQGIVTFTGTVGPDNPFTALPWTAAEVGQLGAAGGTAIGLLFEQAGGGTPNFRLFQMFVTVTYTTETRVAVASVQVPVAPGTLLVDATNVRVPDTGVATWAKANGTLYTYLYRLGITLQAGVNVPLSAPGGWVLLPWLDSGSTAPMQTNGEAESFTVTLGSGARPTSLGNPTTRLRTVLPRTTLPAYSESTQPFFTRIRKPIYDAANSYASQQVTSTLARTFARCRFVCRPQPGNTGNDLIVRVATAPGIGVGNLVTRNVTLSEVLASENVGTAADPWYLVDVLIPPVAFLAATTNFVRFEATAGVVNTNGWDIAYSLGAGLLGEGTYLETTSAGFLQAVQDGRIDFPVTLATIPAPPANVTATPTTIPLPGTGEDCSIDDYQGVTVEWDVSPDALVTEAEIQRFDELTQQWDTIAFVDQVPPILSYLDGDPAQNIENCYRVRFLRATGEASAWSTEVCATPSFPTCGLIFVPWNNPAGAVGYTWPPDHEWNFLDADRLVMFPIYGADGQVAFRPTETLGDQFQVDVIVNAVATPTPREGRWVFDLLVDLAHNPTTPYVSVLDETGRRWYATVQVPSGVRHEPGKLYTATATITTLQFTPSAVPA